jgi:tRNA G18 (ribose-2'-O)-methylase SpoU
VYIGGISPYPRVDGDTRLPHIVDKLTSAIAKTALGAEKTVRIVAYSDVFALLDQLRTSGASIVALEQHERSVALESFVPPEDCVLIVGREVEGIETVILDAADSIVEIPIVGSKESLNVSVATAIALYSLTK